MGLPGMFTFFNNLNTKHIAKSGILDIVIIKIIEKIQIWDSKEGLTNV